jgi:GDPmannose 4,6-dehydratase
VDEKGYAASVTGDAAPSVKPGDCVVAVDPRYFRPTEVETLLGDPSLAKAELGWVPEITARRLGLLRAHGHGVVVAREG